MLRSRSRQPLLVASMCVFGGVSRWEVLLSSSGWIGKQVRVGSNVPPATAYRLVRAASQCFAIFSSAIGRFLASLTPPGHAPPHGVPLVTLPVFGRERERPSAARRSEGGASSHHGPQAGGRLFLSGRVTAMDGSPGAEETEVDGRAAGGPSGNSCCSNSHGCPDGTGSSRCQKTASVSERCRHKDATCAGRAHDPQGGSAPSIRKTFGNEEQGCATRAARHKVALGWLSSGC